MPVWTPGCYLVREFSAHVEGLRVTDSAGVSLPVRKTTKNRWSVETSGTTEISVEYDIWAGRLSVCANWVEPSLALLNGSGVFLYTAQSRTLPQEVSVRLPASWSTVHTSMDAVGPDTTFRAADFDELVDSPIVAGNSVEHTFEVNGQSYGLVFSSDNRYWDFERAVEDVKKLIKTQQVFWGVNPLNKKYLFMTLFMGKDGGLEHDHSTVLLIEGMAMRKRDRYRRWLGLVSHELFHVWNVRRMRPAALSQYDYDRENYTREHWLVEGLTSYFDELLLHRSGLMSEREYFDLLALEIHDYETVPGRKVRSAESASFDAWIKQDSNTVNSTVSYYRKGAVIGFVADTIIRKETGGRASLDDVMRNMYQRYGSLQDGGYPPGAFEAEVEALAGSEVRIMFESMIRGTGDLEVDAALDWYGLSLNRNPAAKGDGPPPGGFGIKVYEKGSKLLVKQVVAGHSGAQAGLLPGDELIAVDGNRVTAASYRSVLTGLLAGEVVEVVLSRHGRLLTVSAELQVDIPGKYAISPNEKPSAGQESRMEQWLGHDKPKN
jgi:predicted metalloprotease with PDZ domain